MTEKKNTLLFKNLLKERILILDGGMGTMIQKYKLTEEDYRGERFAGFPGQLKGNGDLLSITRPDIIRSVHRQYLDAGADIFTTNTFNANAVSMEDYGMTSLVREINLAAGSLARELADAYMQEHPGRTVFIAGSLGPTNKTASMSPDVNDPAYRAVHYTDLYHSYYEQVDALIDGGIDLILFETVFDTLNVKAGLEATMQAMQKKGCILPVMLSLTLSGKGGRTFSGQTLAAFLASVQHVPLTSIGLNCSFGASDMKPYLEELSRIAPYYISAHPNAGLPNQMGEYDETPETMAEHMRLYVEEGLVNIIGGCCGTTPAHIARYAGFTGGAEPHRPNRPATSLWLSGLELLEVKPENNFINIGERCNVAGSRKFLRLIKEQNYDEALSIARKQVEDGARVIDINMDDGLLDTVKEITTFLHLIASEPDIARVPVMIDSSRWEAIEQALLCVQGKSIVNSISLKEGEEQFLQRARRIRQLGAAVVVMAFDEQGQADLYERKIEVCARAYRLLVEKAGFLPQNIIFDPNVLAIATGMSEHNRYGLDFIRAVGWIKQHLPEAKVSGGVSNLSFSFRGNHYIREAMHAVFLYHAIREGMDMGIVNPSAKVLYEDIALPLRNLLEDVVLNRREDAAEELTAYAQEHSPQIAGTMDTDKNSWRRLPLEDRLTHALVKGITDYLENDLQEALASFDKAVQIIDGPLMNGMNKVGELFGAGKMFLPQVVKTARTMKKAVAMLQPAIASEKSASDAQKAGKVVFATVKGDVHDIGKNIVSIVLTCNNYEVIDLGVMVPAEKIIATVVKEKPDILCLSGLITPSLDEMIHVVDEMKKAGQNIPIMVGGATTSKIHTALKIAPHYDHPVIHVTDASQNPIISSKILNPATKDQYVENLNREYEQLRKASSEEHAKPLLSLEKARANRPEINWKAFHPAVPRQTGVHRLAIPLTEIIPYIHWTFFFTAWRMNGRYGDLSRIHNCAGCKDAWLAQYSAEERPKAEEAIQLFHDAQLLLNRLVSEQVEICKAVYGFFPAISKGDDLYLGNGIIIPALRQQVCHKEETACSLADYIMPASEGRSDYIGAFALTAGLGLESLKAGYEAEGDNYHQMLLQTLADRLAEAAAEYLHEKVRKEFWGYAPDESYTIAELFKVRYRGIRPAIGYPSLPDQQQLFILDQLLDIKSAGIRITENGAMYPAASIAGLYFAHPEAHYFMVGRISEEQLKDYAARSCRSEETVRKFLIKNLDSD
ncbi:MAG: methionine synthase [Tannerella sp.]|jgi:5-methyltetrahydrofolate--homocysteine methyltransferase|nr:methionine synthase [Tannerella sp.]